MIADAFKVSTHFLKSSKEPLHFIVREILRSHPIDLVHFDAERKMNWQRHHDHDASTFTMLMLMFEASGS